MKNLTAELKEQWAAFARLQGFGSIVPVGVAEAHNNTVAWMTCYKCKHEYLFVWPGSHSRNEQLCPWCAFWENDCFGVEVMEQSILIAVESQRDFWQHFHGNQKEK